MKNSVPMKLLQFLAALCLLSVIPAKAAQFGDFTYTVTYGVTTYATVTGYTGAGGVVTMPETINGLSVTSIGQSAFQNKTSLTSVTIPNSVTNIGQSAFQSCTKLTSLTIPNSVTSIGDNAFYNCSGLTSLTIGSGVTGIGQNAFYNCSGLTSLTIPDSVTSIGYYAFNNCTSLTSVSIGSVIDSNGIKNSYVFPGCVKLKNLTIVSGTVNISQNASLNSLGLTSVTIGTSVTSIGDYAFSGYANLTSVTIGNGVTSIGNFAFNGCTSLTKITIPSSVTSIGNDAFNNCGILNAITVDLDNSNFSSVGGVLFNKSQTTLIRYPSNRPGTAYTISVSVLSVGESAFQSCPRLTSVSIGNSVTSIGNTAFYNCSGLTILTIPNSVTSIGSEAFYNCSGLTSLTIPNSIISIGYSAFSACSGLTSLTIGNGVTNIGRQVFYNCTSLTSVTIPNSVTNIGQSAFQSCTKLTSLTIPNSVTSIGDYAFYNCSGLTSLTFGNGVNSIGSEAFGYCSGLTSLTIPDSVTSIGYAAFVGCSALTSLTIGNGVTSIGNSAFISCTSLTKITIPSSVTSIGNDAFNNCTSLTSVSIGSGVTSIGDGAFQSCTKLTSLTIPISVTSIGNRTFNNCPIQSVVFAGNPPTVGASVFPSGTIYYSFEATNWGATFAGRPTELMVNPVIMSQPESVISNKGTTVIFAIVATGNDSLVYQWKKGGVNVPGATLPTLSLGNVQSTDMGSYTVTVSDVFGSVSSNAATLTVIDPVTITLQPVSETANQGTGISLIVASTGTNPTYQWKKGGLNISGATLPTLNLGNVQLNDMGSYTVTVSNAMGSVTSNEATITVIVPPAITGQPTNIIANPGESAVFRIVATGSNPTYKWMRNGTIVAGATLPSLSFSAIQPVHVGTYAVVVTNAAGTVTSTSVSLTLNTVYSQAQYDVIAQAAQADIISSPNSYGLYDLSQVQALNVGTPLLAKDSATGKFKLTVKAKKSTDLVNYSDMPFSAEDAVINSNGEMEFQFTSPDNAAFFRIESR